MLLLHRSDLLVDATAPSGAPHAAQRHEAACPPGGLTPLRTGWRRGLIAGAALTALPLGAGAILHAHYHSWHPCDWLLQDTVGAILRRSGVDPDTASVVLRATTVESPEARAALERHQTPSACLAAWGAGMVRRRRSAR